MPYRIDLRGAGDAALDRLVDLGALDVESHGDGLAALMPDAAAPEDVARAVGAGDYTVSAAAGRDENSVWTLTARPVRAGSHTLHLADARVFGTGLHPTTALCLGILEELATQDPPASLLDVGTGSGVLAIAAALLGVPRVTVIDIDVEALAAAAANARSNGVADRLELLHGGIEVAAGIWPLVVANILAAPLIEMAPVLAQRVGHHGRLVLSGIAESVEAEVLRAYRHLGMRHVRSDARGGWVAVLQQATW